MAIRKTAAMPKKYYFERSERLVGLSEMLFGETGASDIFGVL